MVQNEIEAHGVRLAYRRQGTHPRTIVLVHGNSAAKEVFARQFSHFEDAPVSLLAIDLPGHGASANAPAPQAAYTIPGYADVISAALRALEVGDYVVAGWSLGGQIALELAGRDVAAPQAAFRGAVIFGASPVGPGAENLERAFLPATFESAVQAAEPSDALIDAYVCSIFGTLDPVPEEYFAFARRTDGCAREIMAAHWISGVSGCDQARTAATWEKPICVMHGNRDVFVSLDYLKETPWRNLWGGKVFEFPACGHAPFIEQPDAFNAILEDFVFDTLQVAGL